MKVIGLSAIGLIGGIAVGIFGLMPFVGSKIPTDSTMNRVVAQRPVIPVEPESTSEHGLIPAGDAAVVDGVEAGRTPDRQGTDVPRSEGSARGGATVESNLRFKVELLDRGMESFQSVTDYTAKMQKRELVHGELLDAQTMALKIRHKPFSVYLVWLEGDVGREVIYVDGANNGKMIAHDGGWKARIPAFSLTPDGTLAMHDARYPVTSAGLLGLIKVMVGIHREDLTLSNVAVCELDEHQKFDGRPCYQFTTKYKSATESPIYRKSVTLIDHEWNVPLHSRHYEWPREGTEMPDEELDDATLLESYSFTDVKLRCDLSDHDFDRTNPEYRFR